MREEVPLNPPFQGGMGGFDRGFLNEVAGTGGYVMKRIFLFMSVFFLILTSHASAIEPVAVPAFTVQSMSDIPVGSDQLSQAPRWILVYLTDDCRNCDEILHTLEAYRNPPISGRIAIIVGGGTTEKIHKLVGPREKLLSINWYADPDWQAYQALSISGTPVSFGIRDGVIEWSLAGTPSDKKTTDSILTDWVKY